MNYQFLFLSNPSTKSSGTGIAVTNNSSCVFWCRLIIHSFIHSHKMYSNRIEITNWYVRLSMICSSIVPWTTNVYTFAKRIAKYSFPQTNSANRFTFTRRFCPARSANKNNYTYLYKSINIVPRCTACCSVYALKQGSRNTIVDAQLKSTPNLQQNRINSSQQTIMDGIFIRSTISLHEQYASWVAFGERGNRIRHFLSPFSNIWLFPIITTK